MSSINCAICCDAARIRCKCSRLSWFNVSPAIFRQRQTETVDRAQRRPQIVRDGIAERFKFFVRRFELGRFLRELVVQGLDRLLRLLAFRYVFGDAQQILRLAFVVEQRNFFRVKKAQSVVFRLDRLFGDVDQLPVDQHLPVFFGEKICFVFRKKVVIVFSDERGAFISEQFFAGFVESHEPQAGRVLHEHHVRDVLDDRVEKFVQAYFFPVGRFQLKCPLADAALEFVVRFLQRRPAPLYFLQHLIEGLDQCADFVLTGCFDAH